jgi:integrase/recombinase XerC
MTDLTLVLTSASLVGRTERLSRLESDGLRRLAVTACRDQDVTALWNLAEAYAYLVTRGRKGALVSPRTLETYQDSVSQFVAWAVPAGVSLLRPKPAEGFAYVCKLEGSGLRPSVQVRLSGARAL